MSTGSRATRSCRSARPSATARLSVIASLPQLFGKKYERMAGSPSTSRPTKRLGSGRCGFSTRMTRAPSHTSRYVRNGSVVACSRARTVTPSRARVIVSAPVRSARGVGVRSRRAFDARGEPESSGLLQARVASFFRPPIHHAHGFALRPLEAAGWTQADLGTERQRVVQVALDARGDADVAPSLRFDQHGHALGAALGVEHDLVFVAHAGVSEQQRL